MIGVVHGRADQVVHRGVQHQETAAFGAFMDVDHLAQQHASVGGDHPAGLKGELDIQARHDPADHRGIVGRRGRGRLVEIGHAQAAAQVEALDGKALAADALDQAAHLAEGLFHGGQVGDLAADVAGDADGSDARQVGGRGVEPLGFGERDAELVVRLAGGDLGMTAGRDVGIDPDRRGGAHAHGLGHAIDQMEFGLGLDVDFGNAGLQGEGDLALRLADAGEHDPIRRNPGGQRPAQFAF